MFLYFLGRVRIPLMIYIYIVAYIFGLVRLVVIDGEGGGPSGPFLCNKISKGS